HKKEFSLYALHKIQKHVNAGSNVLADVSWYVTQKEIQALEPMSLTFCVLAYCPFNAIIDRLLQCNKQAVETNTIANYRFFIEPIASFESLYDLTPQPHNAI